MRKNVFGRNLKRDTKERKALFRSLMSSLVLDEQIKTTEEKAKSIKGQVEKLVTKAKNGGTHVESMLSSHLNAEAIKKMTTDVAPRFVNRPGGYTRIIRLDRRFNDNASMVIIEWVEKPQPKADRPMVEKAVKPSRGKATVTRSVSKSTKPTAKRAVKKK